MNHAIISSFLDDLAVQASHPDESPDDLPIELESVRGDQRNAVEFHAADAISKQPQRVSVAPSPNNSGRPETRSYLDRNKDPHGMVFSADHGPHFVGLQLCDLNPSDPSIVESTTQNSGFLQPAIHRVPSNLLDSGNRRFVHSLDAQSGDFIEGSSPMLEAVIDRAPVPAESPAAHLASEPTALAPAGWVKTKTNDHSPRGFRSQ